jgi:signal transduction histidine kinase
MPDDTLKVPVLIQLGQQYENNSPDTAIRLYTEAEKLSTRLHYDAGIIQYIKNYTAVLNVQGKYDSSLALNNRALELARSHGWQLEIMKTLINLGVVYQYKESYTQALDYYLRALAIAEKIPGYQIPATLYGNMCGLYRNLGQQEKAEIYARKALTQAEVLHDRYATGEALNNLANVLKDRGHISEGMALLKRGITIGKELKDVGIEETSLINMGDGYEKLRQPDKYLAVFREALPLADSIGDVMGKAIILQGIAEAFFHMKKFREGWKAMQEALQYARTNDQKEVQSHLLMLMSDTQIALGNTDNAESYRGQYDSVRNLLVNESMLKNIQELETRYGAEKSQRELTEKNLLLEEGRRIAERQRLLLIASILALLLLAALLITSFRIYKQKRELDRKALLSLKAEQENIRLRSVLEGETQERRRISQEMHDDMGSGLTSLLFLSRMLPGGTGAQIGEGAEQLIHKMNGIIWSMNDEQDTLDSLVAYIRTNTATTLDTAGLQYNFSIPEPIPQRSLGQEFRRNIYLVVKEAVHNVVKHASATRVNIGIGFENGLRVVVSDDGKGMNSNGANRFGNGMKNMQRRMETVGGSLTILSEGATTQSTLAAATTQDSLATTQEGTAGTTLILEAPWPV